MIWENVLKVEFRGDIHYVDTDENKVALAAMMAGMDKDGDAQLISAYLFLAGQEILQRCYPFGYGKDEKVPERYGGLQCQICAYLLGRRGAEGQISHSENGVMRVYESGGVPESMLSQITPRGAVY